MRRDSIASLNSLLCCDFMPILAAGVLTFASNLQELLPRND
jgi:hypothetical protein